MSLNIHWYDIAGLAGVAVMLWAFYLLQAGKLQGHSFAYQLMNAVGAGAVLLSLVHDFNLSAFVIETCWVVISVYGMIRARGRRRDR
jgi:paired small multidrug resistance pump